MSRYWGKLQHPKRRNPISSQLCNQPRGRSGRRRVGFQVLFTFQFIIIKYLEQRYNADVTWMSHKKHKKTVLKCLWFQLHPVLAPLDQNRSNAVPQPCGQDQYTVTRPLCKMQDKWNDWFRINNEGWLFIHLLTTVMKLESQRTVNEGPHDVLMFSHWNILFFWGGAGLPCLLKSWDGGQFMKSLFKGQCTWGCVCVKGSRTQGGF